MPAVPIPITFMHDGLTIDDKAVTIHQRHDKGDVIIPVSSITGMTSYAKRTFLSLRATCRLQLTVGGKRYVIRRLTIPEQEQAVAAIKARLIH